MLFQAPRCFQAGHSQGCNPRWVLGDPSVRCQKLWIFQRPGAGVPASISGGRAPCRVALSAMLSAASFLSHAGVEDRCHM